MYVTLQKYARKTIITKHHETQVHFAYSYQLQASATVQVTVNYVDFN